MAGQQIALQDARANLTSFGYDLAGRLASQTDPLLRVTTYQYDLAGRNTTLIDGIGHVKTLVYDAVNRLVTTLYDDGTAVTFQYDVLGRRTTMVDSGGTTTYVYSARAELIGNTQVGGHVLQMGYDAVGNRTLLVDPRQWIRPPPPTTRSTASPPFRIPDANLTTYQYDAASQRTTLQFATGATRQYQYDLAGRLTTQIEFNAANNPDHHPPRHLRPRRQPNGPQPERRALHLDLRQRLSPHRTGRRPWDTPPSSMTRRATSWRSGSRARSPMSFTYDAANQMTTMLQGSAPTTYTFDRNGNRTIDHVLTDTTDYSYDDENRLVHISAPGAQFNTYTYDGDGRRRSYTERTVSLTTIIWDGDDYLMEIS